MKLKVRVTKSDVLHGQAISCFNCPVARAIYRAATVAGWRVIDRGLRVYGKQINIFLDDGGCLTVQPIPERVVAFIDQFDDPESRGDLVKAFKPFTVTLNLVRIR